MTLLLVVAPEVVSSPKMGSRSMPPLPLFPPVLTMQGPKILYQQRNGRRKNSLWGHPKIRKPPLKFACDATKPLRCRHFSSAIFSDQRSTGNDELPEAGPQVPGGAGGQSGHPVVSQCQQVSGDVIHAWGIFPSGAERSNSIWLTTARRKLWVCKLW